MDKTILNTSPDASKESSQDVSAIIKNIESNFVSARLSEEEIAKLREELELISKKEVNKDGAKDTFRSYDEKIIALRAFEEKLNRTVEKKANEAIMKAENMGQLKSIIKTIDIIRGSQRTYTPNEMIERIEAVEGVLKNRKYAELEEKEKMLVEAFLLRITNTNIKIRDKVIQVLEIGNETKKAKEELPAEPKKEPEKEPEKEKELMERKENVGEMENLTAEEKMKLAELEENIEKYKKEYEEKKNINIASKDRFRHIFGKIFPLDAADEEEKLAKKKMKEAMNDLAKFRAQLEYGRGTERGEKRSIFSKRKPESVEEKKSENIEAKIEGPPTRAEMLKSEVDAARKEYLELDYKKRSISNNKKRFFEGKIDSVISDDEVLRAKEIYQEKLVSWKNARMDDARAKGLSNEELAKVLQEVLVETNINIAETHNQVRSEQQDGKVAGIIKNSLLKFSGWYKKQPLKYKLAVGVGLGLAGVSSAYFGFMTAAACIAYTALGKRMALGAVTGTGAALGMEKLTQRGRQKRVEKQVKEFSREFELFGLTDAEKEARMDALLNDSINNVDKSLRDTRYKNIRNFGVGVLVGSFLGTGAASFVFEKFGLTGPGGKTSEWTGKAKDYFGKVSVKPGVDPAILEKTIPTGAGSGLNEIPPSGTNPEALVIDKEKSQKMFDVLKDQYDKNTASPKSIGKPDVTIPSEPSISTGVEEVPVSQGKRLVIDKQWKEGDAKGTFQGTIKRHLEAQGMVRKEAGTEAANMWKEFAEKYPDAKSKNFGKVHLNDEIILSSDRKHVLGFIDNSKPGAPRIIGETTEVKVAPPSIPSAEEGLRDSQMSLYEAVQRDLIKSGMTPADAKSKASDIVSEYAFDNNLSGGRGMVVEKSDVINYSPDGKIEKIIPLKNGTEEVIDSHQGENKASAGKGKKIGVRGSGETPKVDVKENPFHETELFRNVEKLYKFDSQDDINLRMTKVAKGLSGENIERWGKVKNVNFGEINDRKYPGLSKRLEELIEYWQKEMNLPESEVRPKKSERVELWAFRMVQKSIER